MDIRDELNTVLVDTYRLVLEVEGNMLKSSSKHPLSISEVHFIEAVGKCNKTGRTITEIASDQRITLPTATVAISKLEKKGYVKKNRTAEDRRSVRVCLTEKGRAVDRIHKHFHQKMINEILQDLEEEEKAILLKGVEKLNKFFKKKSEAGKEK